MLYDRKFRVQTIPQQASPFTQPKRTHRILQPQHFKSLRQGIDLIYQRIIRLELECERVFLLSRSNYYPFYGGSDFEVFRQRVK
jgi:hypothetical protein